MTTDVEEAREAYEMQRRREVQGRFITLSLLTVVPVLMVTVCFLLLEPQDAKEIAVFSVAIYLTGGTLVILHVMEWWVEHPRARYGRKGPPRKVLVPAFRRLDIPPYDPMKPSASWMETDIPCPDCGRLLIRMPKGDICVDCEGIELPPELYPE